MVPEIVLENMRKKRDSGTLAASAIEEEKNKKKKDFEGTQEEAA